MVFLRRAPRWAPILAGCLVTPVLRRLLAIGLLVGAALWRAGRKTKPEGEVVPPNPNDDRAADPRHPAPVSVAELNNLPTAIQEYRSDAKEDNRRDKLRLGIEVVATVALLGTLYMSAASLRESQRAADAAARQAELLASQVSAAGAELLVERVRPEVPELRS